MKIFSIETSCDETAVAVVELTGDMSTPEFSILGNALYSQAAKHAEFGGVYPNLAKREHQQNLVPLTLQAMEQGFANPKSEIRNSKQIRNSKKEELEKILEREKELLEQLEKTPELHHNPGVDAIAVTKGPGLEPALWVGINFAKALSHLWQVPLVPVNHMEGHMFSILADGGNSKFKIRNPKELFPALALLVSGGHTELVQINDWFNYEILGRTQDDAVGEAFDKVARLLDLPYPGGPEISRLARLARDTSEIQNSKFETFTLPRPMIATGDYNFSYSGLKTAVRRIVDQKELNDAEKQELAREFEDAALDVLLAKTERALQEFAPKHLIVAGGVIANTELRKRLTALVERYSGVQLALPSSEMATDNAIMIGIAGALHFTHTPDTFSVFDPATSELTADGNWRVDNPSTKK